MLSKTLLCNLKHAHKVTASFRPPTIDSFLLELLTRNHNTTIHGISERVLWSRGPRRVPLDPHGLRVLSSGQPSVPCCLGCAGCRCNGGLLNPHRLRWITARCLHDRL